MAFDRTMLSGPSRIGIVDMFSYRTLDTAATALATQGYFDEAGRYLPVGALILMSFAGGVPWAGLGIVQEASAGHCRIALLTNPIPPPALVTI